MKKNLIWIIPASVVIPFIGFFLLRWFYESYYFFVNIVFPWAKTYKFPNGDVGAVGMLTFIFMLASVIVFVGIMVTLEEEKKED